MRAVNIRFAFVGDQRIRIVTESRDANVVLLQERMHALYIGVSQGSNIEVRYAGVSALCLPGGPAHQFHDAEARLAGECQHFLQRKVRKDGGGETELHTFTQVWARW